MNILVIDDHELFRDGIKLVLEKIDDACEVHTVASGIEALALIESTTDFDIILLDYNLPDITGIDTLKSLKSNAPEIPIVMLSSEESPDRIQAAMKIGANGFITKNSSADVTISAVKLVLSGGMYLPPQLLFSETQASPLLEKHTETAETDPQGVPEPTATNTETSHKARSHQLALTLRQRDVLIQMSNGFSNKEIARHLNMSLSTVKVHVTAIFRELSVNNRVQAINIAKEHQLIED